MVEIMMGKTHNYAQGYKGEHLTFTNMNKDMENVSKEKL